MMEINIEKRGQVQVIQIAGDVDGSTAPEAQSQIFPLVEPDSKILLDMTGVGYMSSAGLRMLLSTYRQVASQQGSIALVGLAEEVKETMAVTGFLKFFTTCETLDEGLKALG
jgi:anti-sigma B factor antagonist